MVVKTEYMSRSPVVRSLLNTVEALVDGLISNGRVWAVDEEYSIWERVSLAAAQLPATFRSSRHLFASLCGPYQDHPPWQISTWKRSQSSGELSGSSLCTPTDFFLLAAMGLESRARSMQPMKTLLRAPERGKKGGSTLCFALTVRLPDSLDPNV